MSVQLEHASACGIKCASTKYNKQWADSSSISVRVKTENSHEREYRFRVTLSYPLLNQMKACLS